MFVVDETPVGQPVSADGSCPHGFRVDWCQGCCEHECSGCEECNPDPADGAGGDLGPVVDLAEAPGARGCQMVCVRRLSVS